MTSDSTRRIHIRYSTSFSAFTGKADYEGTGIGLAMCKKIALNHYGDIVAESIEGEGATFHVFLAKGPTQQSAIAVNFGQLRHL